MDRALETEYLGHNGWRERLPDLLHIINCGLDDGSHITLPPLDVWQESAQLLTAKLDALSVQTVMKTTMHYFFAHQKEQFFLGFCENGLSLSSSDPCLRGRPRAPTAPEITPTVSSLKGATAKVQSLCHASPSSLHQAHCCDVQGPQTVQGTPLKVHQDLQILCPQERIACCRDIVFKVHSRSLAGQEESESGFGPFF